MSYTRVQKSALEQNQLVTPECKNALCNKINKMGGCEKIRTPYSEHHML